MFVILSLLAVAALTVVDQLTKWWAVNALAGQSAIPVWPGVFELTYVENRGAAFGMLQNRQWLFSVLTIVLVGAIAWLLYSRRISRHPLLVTACLLIMAGGIGNLIDRLFNGYVVDFLYFRLIDFPVFNVADICVTVGAVLVIIYLLAVDKHSKQTEDEHGKATSDVASGDDGATSGQDSGGCLGCDASDGAEVDRAGASDGCGSPDP